MRKATLLFLSLTSSNSFGSGCLVRGFAAENAEDPQSYAISKSTHVFVGSAFSMELTTQHTEGLQPYVIKGVTTFKIEEKIKFPEMDKGSVVSIEYELLDCSCGKKFELGKTYTVFAVKTEKEGLKAYFCGLDA